MQTKSQGTVQRSRLFTVECYVVENNGASHLATVDNPAGKVERVPVIDDARFREVAGHFATGVVVVTGRGAAGPVGFTCQSFGSLSLDPLLVFFSARSDGVSWPQIRGTRDVAINILTSRQEALARAFGTSAADKFEGVAWSAGAAGAPLLGDVLATMEGRLASVTVHGDHDLAVVAVDHVALHEGTPLIFYRRGYGSFTA